MGETIVRPFPMWLYIQTWHNQLFGSQKSILYRSQIGALRWNVESTSSQRYRNYHWCSWCPAKVILADAVVRYPEKQHNARAGLCLIKQALLWLTSFYGEARKAIPPDAPAPRRKEIDVQMLADSDHTGGKWMQRSRVSSIVFLNMAPINAKSYLVACYSGSCGHGQRIPRMVMFPPPLFLPTYVQRLHRDEAFVTNGWTTPPQPCR